MSSHPSDPVVADLVRHARVGAAANPYPPRTRSLGEHSARQHSVGSLVVEAARADSGVSEKVAQARREVLAAELERRRLVQAAEEARRQAELDRTQAEQERDEAVRRARERSGPDPDFLTLAVIAAVTLEITEYELAGVLDAAITDTPASRRSIPPTSQVSAGSASPRSCCTPRWPPSAARRQSRTLSTPA
ncbi:hypothetical protein [Dietzia sp. IN118]|uniref:hypothetical protein n=1 Tax=Dietzia sp. IN118 TaxID=3061631 RepID=UPI00293AF7BF|nr:hypothetical protein [Dietzia sp. IN118]MDV3357266.1 hypothetical protein [Dietzia sp. IN118]